MSRKQLSVVPPRLPVEVKPQYSDFDRFVALADRLVRHINAVHELCSRLVEDAPSADDISCAEEFAAEWPQWAELLAKYIEAAARFDRPEFYENYCTEDEVIVRHVVAEKIGMLVDSFEYLPHAPETFVPLLIEEIIATHPNVLVVESLCRQIRRTPKLKRIPSIGDILEMLQQQREQWHDRWDCVDGEKDVVNWQKMLDGCIARAKVAAA
jgi:hypothetical protein